MPTFDLLEGFDPEDAASPYRRVLVPAEARDGAVLLAWTYVKNEARGTHLPGGRWPP